MTTTKTMGHPPTPWTEESDTLWSGNTPVCVIHPKETRRFVLRAVNSHAAIVAACRAALDDLEKTDCGPHGRTRDTLRAALALVEAKHGH